MNESFPLTTVLLDKCLQSGNLGSPFVCFISNCKISFFFPFPTRKGNLNQKIVTFSKPPFFINHKSHLYLRSLNLVRFVLINLDFWSLRHMH